MSSSSSSKFDVVAGSLQRIGLFTLVFLTGTCVAAFRLPPYPQLLEPGFHSLSRLIMTWQEGANDFVWVPATRPEQGVTLHIKQQPSPGLTLYTSGHGTEAFLIDLDGRVVHKWAIDASQTWPEPLHENSPTDPSRYYFRHAEVLPNGDLIAVVVQNFGSPWGHALVKLDRHSNVLWTFDDRCHHDLQVRADGTILAITHRFRQPAEVATLAALPLPQTVLDDELVVLSAEGEVQQRISILEALAAGPSRAVLASRATWRPFDPASGGTILWDLPHTNSVDEITPEFAAHHEFAEAGQVMISMRQLDMVALVDLKTAQVVWSCRGSWRAQHDPDPLPNGNVLLLDNVGGSGPGGRSRVLEFHPGTGAIAWSYEGTAQQPFETTVRGKQQLLPNGNVLITDSHNGRIFEVTRSGEVVWEYLNPQRRTAADGTKSVAVMCGASRWAESELPFLTTTDE